MCLALSRWNVGSIYQRYNKYQQSSCDSMFNHIGGDYKNEKLDSFYILLTKQYYYLLQQLSVDLKSKALQYLWPICYNILDLFGSLNSICVLLKFYVPSENKLKKSPQGHLGAMF